MDVGLRWLVGVLFATMVGAVAFQAWLGYDVAIIIGLVLGVIVLSLVMHGLAEGLEWGKRALARSDRGRAILRTARDLGSVARWLIKAAIVLPLAVIVIALAVSGINSISIPAAIVVGALIIASAIGSSRR